MAQDARERFAKKNETEDLRRAFDKLDTKGDGKIDAQELREIFSLLRHDTKKAEVEDIIWEVDDDSDKCVSWAEFQAMYHRCRVDRTGYEPRRLFNIVEFMMNDRDGSGSVSVEEAMQILYLRFGKGLLDTVIFKIVESLPLHHLILLCFAQQLEEIFGTSDTNSTKDLSLTEFLQSVTTSHVKQLRSKLAS